MLFIPFFGSALQVTPHFHSLVPDGVFVPWEGGVHFEELPPPTQAEVEKLLKVVRHQVLRLLFPATATLHSRTFDFDVVACVRCGGRLKSLSQ